jgi:hypothetical protein
VLRRGGRAIISDIVSDEDFLFTCNAILSFGVAASRVRCAKMNSFGDKLESSSDP